MADIPSVPHHWFIFCQKINPWFLGLLGLFYPISSTKVWLTTHLFHIIGSSFGSNSMHCALMCLFCENTIHWMWRCYFWRLKMVIFINFARLDRKILHPSSGSWSSSEYLYQGIQSKINNFFCELGTQTYLSCQPKNFMRFFLQGGILQPIWYPAFSPGCGIRLLTSVFP